MKSLIGKLLERRIPQFAGDLHGRRLGRHGVHAAHRGHVPVLTVLDRRSRSSRHSCSGRATCSSLTGTAAREPIRGASAEKIAIPATFCRRSPCSFSCSAARISAPPRRASPWPTRRGTSSSARSRSRSFASARCSSTSMPWISPDEDLWLTGFIPDAVYIDLLGDDFLDPVGPNQFVEKLRRAGYRSCATSRWR